MEKIKLENIKLSKEIKEYGKTKDKTENYPFPVFLSEIPYKGFKIILAHPMPPKEVEEFYYSKSRYGWWCFCADKNELDELDKKLLNGTFGEYGQYKEKGHSFCNDNQQDNRYINELHPNKMVEEVKKQIDLFYKNKKKLENENKKD